MKALANLGRWLVATFDPPPRAPTLYAICRSSSLHGSPAEVTITHPSRVEMRRAAMVMHADRGPNDQHEIIRVVRYEPVDQWDPEGA